MPSLDPLLFGTAVCAIGGLTFLLATMLVIANRILYVEVDPRLEIVVDLLPGTNCGGCGYPGCQAFADALVAGDVLPGKCSVSLPVEQERIAGFLQIDVGQQEKRIARLACAGGTNVARVHAHYGGLKSCAAATLVSGGGKGCFWGCLGIGDCEVACTFDAIEMNAHRLPVVNESKCTACGDCVSACPKDLFSLQLQTHRLWVACRSQEAGDEILEDCEVACTACGRCAMDAPGLVEMQGNLPIIDYSKGQANSSAIKRCPTGAIVWFGASGEGFKGEAARKVIRQETIPESPT